MFDVWICTGVCWNGELKTRSPTRPTPEDNPCWMLERNCTGFWNSSGVSVEDWGPEASREARPRGVDLEGMGPEESGGFQGV